MKLEQSKLKLVKAKELDSKIRELTAQIEDIEEGIKQRYCVRLWFRNTLNAECDSELSGEIMNIALSAKKSELDYAEKEFNALWRQRRGGKNDD